MFDFKKNLQASRDLESSKSLYLLAMGQQGAGKSFLAGTLGVKTLYLYFSGESHGTASAKIEGASNIETYCLDVYAGNQLSPDDTFKHLLFVLNNAEMIEDEGYKLIVIDSASELEILIRETKEWDKATTSSSGKHDGYAEKGATIDMFRKVTSVLKNLQRKLDVHIMMTCILDVRSVGELGEIMESSPRIRGAGVAEFLNLQFDDVVAVGRMQKDGITKHKIQMGVNMSKVAKEVSGGQKTINYNPRIKGIKTEDLPPFMPADLKVVANLKRTGVLDEAE